MFQIIYTLYPRVLTNVIHLGDGQEDMYVNDLTHPTNANLIASLVIYIILLYG